MLYADESHDFALKYALMKLRLDQFEGLRQKATVWFVEEMEALGYKVIPCFNDYQILLRDFFIDGNKKPVWLAVPDSYSLGEELVFHSVVGSNALFTQSEEIRLFDAQFVGASIAAVALQAFPTIASTFSVDVWGTPSQLAQRMDVLGFSLFRSLTPAREEVVQLVFNQVAVVTANGTDDTLMQQLCKQMGLYACPFVEEAFQSLERRSLIDGH